MFVSKKPNVLIRILCWLLFIALLPVFLLSLIIKGIIKHHKYKEWKRKGETGRKLILSTDITAIDLMEGYEFEEYLKCLFFYQDYEVELTPKSRDYGADLILTKGDEVIVVQAKRYNKTVGSKCVAEIVGAKNHYNATDAYVVSNSYFSGQAETLAKENGVRLIDRDELIEMSKEVCDKLSINNQPGEVAYNSAYGEQSGEPSFRI